MSFTHLHVHTEYSLLDGLTKIDRLLDYVKKNDMDSVAITDHGVLYGAIEFYQKAKKEGIKPIIGCELYMAFDGRHNKRPNIDNKSYHMLLLAKNQEGYRNLVHLVTKANLEGFYYKPRIDEEILKTHSKGLIALSACIQGKIPRLILSGQIEKARELAIYYENLFGKDNFYLEIQHHPNIKEQEIVNKELIKISKETGIPLVATCDSHYLRPEDAKTQDILLSIGTGSDINNSERLTMEDEDFSMHPPEKMKELFKDHPEAIENTQKIKDLCNLEIELGKTILPSFPLDKGETANEKLQKLCEEGISKRYPPEKEEEAKTRLKEEMDVITGANLSSYFLIVQDFTIWAKKNKIVVGPGRGSAGGSIIAYLLGITNIDPLHYGLIFERFLNPGRAKVSLPDIDLDFADRRRDEVISYIAKKYGEDRVAQIITFGTMAARAAIRDVGRVLGYSYSYCDKIAKMIPMGTNLEETKEKVLEFRQIYDTDESARKLIDHAEKLEGVVRHASTHACGVVISDRPLPDIVPLQHPTQGGEGIITQYEMKSVESLGLLKMDLLGLKNLTIIENTLKRIYAIRKENIDIEEIPLNDKKAFRILKEGNTVGIFQLECLSGDTIISNTTIKKLYEKRDKRKIASLYLDEGKIHLNEIIDVIDSGKRKVYTLVTENNRYIKATKGHRFLTKDGWKELKNIKIGESVLMRDKAKHLIYRKCTESYHGKEKADKMKKELSKRFSGSKNPMFGRVSPHGKRGFRKDLGHFVRSSWEADFARILKLYNLYYEYEPKTFSLIKKNGDIIHYTPDFYVPSKNTFYEVKGFLRDADKEKIKLFKKQYPQYEFVLINNTLFAELSLKYKTLIDWECPQVPEKGFDFVKVKKIKYSGIEKTYDIKMKSPANNFQANSFIVHNSGGMQRYLKQLRPSNMEEIIAMISLYRPGPMKFLPDYIARKQGKKDITYLHPNLKPILKPTYGILVYQEQIIRIATDLAGFSREEADTLRKAIGKKIKELMDQKKEQFINGIEANDMDHNIAKEIWEWIEPFAQYSFNKSHAAAYAQIAYQTAYLKAHYPREFMSALLTADQNDTERIGFLIADCKKMGIEVLPPDINESFMGFSVVPDKMQIRFGLSAIKNVGDKIVEKIVKERKENGLFASLDDFLSRVQPPELNKKSLESLIKAGAFDKFKLREDLVYNLEKLLEYSREKGKCKNNGQGGLFDGDASQSELSLEKAPLSDTKEKLKWEKELLGLFVTGHPLEYLKEKVENGGISIEKAKRQISDAPVRVGAVISTIKKIITKAGDPMLFVTIEDVSDNIEVIVFPRMLENNGSLFEEGKAVFIAGKISHRDDTPKIICEKAEIIE